MNCRQQDAGTGTRQALFVSAMETFVGMQREAASITRGTVKLSRLISMAAMLLLLCFSVGAIARQG